jgi:radical SAM superfamily enzyme YgiQ (UPF0313 family)
MQKIKVGMVQINTSFFNQEYLPYSLGLLQAYAEKYLDNVSDFEFLLPIYKRIPLKEAVRELSGAEIIFFSLYTWNTRISLEIARLLKKRDSNVITVFGGPGISCDKVEKFLRENPQVNLACLGNGEITFTLILKNLFNRNWREISGINYLDKNNEVILSQYPPRIFEINSIPSPFLEEIFQPLIKANPKVNWIALWETNRGCPFSCTYCDWGSATQNRVFTFGMERLYKEVEWFKNNKIEFITCCDSNFGMLERDYEIIKFVADNKIKFGYPEGISVQSTKNFKEHTYNTYKLLAEAGLNTTISLSLQSTNEDTLKAIKRINMKINHFKEVKQKLTNIGVDAFTDIILGLPEETYDSYVNGISEIIENGQHNRITFSDLNILPNAEMGRIEYQEKYSFDIMEKKLVNRHGSLSVEEVFENELVVTSTNTLTREDWIKAKVFAWVISLLHFNKLLQIPFVILNKFYGISFRKLAEIFTENKSTGIFEEIISFFTKKALETQNGEIPHCESKEWLNIWWPTDEYKFIDIIKSNRLNEFYVEAEKILTDYLTKIDTFGFEKLLHESLLLNKTLLKLPFQGFDKNLNLSYNIWECYQAILRGIEIELVEKEVQYKILCSKIRWLNWEDWYEEVVWFSYKNGNYIYNCERMLL